MVLWTWRRSLDVAIASRQSILGSLPNEAARLSSPKSLAKLGPACVWVAEVGRAPARKFIEGSATYLASSVANRTGNRSYQMQEIFGTPRVHAITGFLIATKNINLKKLWHTNLYIQPWRPPPVEETVTLKVLMVL